MQNKLWKKSIVIGIILLFFGTSVVPISKANQAITWDATLSFTETGGSFDNAVFGEAPDAHDGPPSDNYDVAKPPPQMPPYIRACFKDNLSVPYNNLWEDYREYPDTQKTWNLTVQWVPEDGVSPTTINITWNPAQIDQNEYMTVYLCTTTGMILQNMLVTDTYTFTCEAYVLQNFKIICSSSTNQPPVFGSPTPVNGSTNNPVSFSWSIPISDPEGDTYSWTIQCNNGQNNSGTGASNGTKTLSLSSLAYSTTYKVWVNATDPGGSGLHTRRWYNLTTKPQNNPPGGGGGGETPQNKKPTANLSAGEPYRGYVNESITFNGSLSYDPDGNITAWFWTFGDGTNGTGKITNHTYHKTGTFTVTLKVTDNKGATDNDTTAVNITKKPNITPSADFSIFPINATTDDAIQFTDRSTDPDGIIVSWSWTFGDGTHSTEKNPAHRFNQSGIYQVTLNVTDNNGAFHSTSKLIFIEKSKNSGVTATGTKGIPGFELIVFISAITLVFLWRRKSKKQN